MSAAGERAPVGVAVVGLGFMGATHLAAYAAADAAGWSNRLVAVCDRDGDRRRGLLDVGGNFDTGARAFDPERTVAHADVADLLADPAVELVSITTPTDSHVPLALAALEAGKHVLVEKPVATTLPEVVRLADAAAASGRHCLPALCMRFWPGWDWLRARVRDGALGPVRSAVFRRLGTRPDWGAGFYDDPGRCGGALFDLHVHDADLVLWLFGAPQAVSVAGHRDHLTAAYHYADGPAHVIAEGCWDADPARPFSMGYEVVFEGGTAVWTLGDEAPLVLYRDGAAEPVPVAEGSGYDGEVRHMLDVVGGRAAPRASLAEMVALTVLLEAEAASLDQGGARVGLGG